MEARAEKSKSRSKSSKSKKIAVKAIEKTQAELMTELKEQLTIMVDKFTKASVKLGKTKGVDLSVTIAFEILGPVETNNDTTTTKE